MKKIVILATCLFTLAAPAFGLEMQVVESVKTIELRGSQLNTTYEVSGGCAEHEGFFRVTLEKETQSKNYVARVALYDKVETADNCEAIISVSAEADLNSLIKNEATRQNIKAEDLERVRIQLPALNLSQTL